MPDAVRIQLRTQALRDHVDVGILEILGHAGDKGDADRRREQQADALEELTSRVFLEARGVLVNHVAENERIEQREDLVDGGQRERQRDQPAVVPEV